MPNDLKPCPNTVCESTRLRSIYLESVTENPELENCIMCEACGYHSPWADSREKAKELHNGILRREDATRCEIGRLDKELCDLREAVDRSGMEASTCLSCGEMVYCVPAGLPMCAACAEENDAEGG